MEIITNNQPRQVIYGYDLSDKEKQEFNYVVDLDSYGPFFRYKGLTYDLNEFQRVTDTMENCHGFNGWDGFQSDSFFSGIVIKYTADYEHVIAGRFYS